MEYSLRHYNHPFIILDFDEGFEDLLEEIDGLEDYEDYDEFDVYDE